MPRFDDAARRTRGLVRRQLNRAGLELSLDPYLNRVVKLLDLLDLETVIDVGANEGQYGGDLRALHYTGRILSFEPLSTPFARLAKASARDERWRSVQAAVSDQAGSITVHIAGNSVSSSVLPMLGTHASAAPKSQYVGEESVPATTVDLVVTEFDVDPERTYLKVDVQGFESAVLDGASSNLSRFAAVQLELSLVPLYGGQALMRDLIDRMAGLGFELWILMPEFSDPSTGRSLQCDGVFVRRDLIEAKLTVP